MKILIVDQLNLRKGMGSRESLTLLPYVNHIYIKENNLLHLVIVAILTNFYSIK